MISYRTGNDLNLDQVVELYRASTLGERRPIDDRERFAAMLRNANLVITAWDGDLLVGISGRSRITAISLSDVWEHRLVHCSFAGARGVGNRLHFDSIRGTL